MLCLLINLQPSDMFMMYVVRTLYSLLNLRGILDYKYILSSIIYSVQWYTEDNETSNDCYLHIYMSMSTLGCR